MSHIIILERLLALILLRGFTNNLLYSEKKLKWKKGDYGVPKNFEEILAKFINLEELNSPLNWMKKFKLIKGDAQKNCKAIS